MHLFFRKTLPVAHFEPQNKMQVHKWDFIWRTLVFIILEFAFLALATLCLIRPIPLLPNSTSSHTLVIAKAIMTTIAVAWHTVALFPMKNIITTVFSAECMAQYRRTGHLQPSVTDRVSCITSGWLAQISHFLTLRPTLEYRLAFLLALSTMVLVPLGPSVIGLNLSLITHYEDLRIANLTVKMAPDLTSDPKEDPFFTTRISCAKKADEIVYLEAVEGRTYGYKAQEKQMLIPWPNPGFEESQRVIKYESDVVVYDYICQWPKFMFDGLLVVITDIADVSWIPLFVDPTTSEEWEHGFITPLDVLPGDSLPLSAFTFIRGDSLNDPLGTVETWVPTTELFLQEGIGISSQNLSNMPGPMMAATLLCNPHYTISRAEVTLQNGQLHANLVEGPLLGNFPEPAADCLFSEAFLNAFTRGVGMSSPGVFPFTTGPGDIQTLLTLPEINSNLNRIIQSAAKAYISGYTGFNQSGLEVFPTYISFNQTTTTQYPEISLVSSRSFLVALWVLNGVVILILAILVWITNVKEIRLFNLQTMETVYRDLPTSDDGLPLPQQHPPDLYANKLEFAWRVIAFAILEFSFLAFAGYCSTNPIPVHPPSFISPSQAKSATTAIVVAWRTLAVFPIKDIVLLVFSTECTAQYRQTGHLEPNITDRVSHSTSGLMDQISHFLVGWPTLGYRLAFLLGLFVVLIGPLGPGVVTLSELPTTSPQELLVANLSSLSSAFMSDDAQFQGQSQRAQPIIQAELLEGRVYGYDTMPEGVLIPWPESGFGQSENVTMYRSDVAVYNYSCRWTSVETNQINDTITIPSVPPNGTEAYRWFDRGLASLPSFDTIFPLLMDITYSSSQSPLSAVAFSGSTLIDVGSTGASVRFHIPANKTMSLSVLLCDPQFKIYRANVTFSSGKLTANVLPALPLLGNFPEHSASALFSQALMNSLGEGDMERQLSSISMLLFTGEPNGTGVLHPFPLPVINDNMNRALKSAAKAYLSGYDPSGNPESTLPSYEPWNQTATVQYQQLALVASRPFLVGLLSLVAPTVVILVMLLKAVDIGKVQLFNLQTLEKIYGDEALA